MGLELPTAAGTSTPMSTWRRHLLPQRKLILCEIVGEWSASD